MAGERGQYERDRVATGRDGEPPKRDTGDIRLRGSSVRQTWRRRHAEVDDPRDNRHRLILELLNAEAAHLQKTGESGRRPRNQPAVNGFDMDTVVGHQTRKDQPAAGGSVEEVEHEPRFSGARGAADEKGPRTCQDR
jgi:hypothetical protein